MTTEGVEQANKLAPRLNRLNIDALFSSPYLRALETINPFAQSATLSISTLDNLRERCLAPTPLPDWPDHIERSFKDTSYKLPGGESLNETCDRALKALRTIAASKSTLPAAVSHGNLIASVLNRIDPEFGFLQWKNMKNPDLFEISVTAGKPQSFTRL